MHAQREPARRHERLGALVDEAGIDQPVGHELAQILRRPRLHARGNFLGEQFEQQVGHGGALEFTLPWRGRVGAWSAPGWGDGVAAFCAQGKWLGVARTMRPSYTVSNTFALCLRSIPEANDAIALPLPDSCVRSIISHLTCIACCAQSRRLQSLDLQPCRQNRRCNVRIGTCRRKCEPSISMVRRRYQSNQLGLCRRSLAARRALARSNLRCDRCTSAQMRSSLAVPRHRRASLRRPPPTLPHKGEG